MSLALVGVVSLWSGQSTNCVCQAGWNLEHSDSLPNVSSWEGISRCEEARLELYETVKNCW